MADREATLKKINGLWAKAMSTTSEAERDAFIEGARRLMEKHAVDESELGRNDREGISAVHWVYSDDASRLDGKKVLLSVAADIAGSGTTVGYWDKPDPAGRYWATIFGFHTPVEATKSLYRQLLTDALHAAWDASCFTDRRVTDFMTGYGLSITRRLETARRQTTTRGVGLVLADRSAEVAKVIAEFDAERSQFEIDDDDAATRAGMAAGRTADLGHTGNRLT